MINRVVLIARITKDPVLHKTASGKSYVPFTLACNRQFNKEEVDYIQCQAWSKTADFMSQYVKKGALLGVEGRIQTRNYDDKNGKKVYVTEVIVEHVEFLESKKTSQQESKKTSDETDYQPDTLKDDNGDDYKLDIASDDLPFN